MPLFYLVHIGIIVAVGVLLDTLPVRLFLVPALIEETGPVVWWPRTLPSDGPGGTAGLVTPRAVPPLPQPTSRS